MSKVLLWRTRNAAEERIAVGFVNSQSELLEYRQFRNEDEDPVGDIRMGMIRQIMPALNAAFVDVGLSKEGFLSIDHTHLGEFKSGQELPLQIQKPAQEPKGPAVTNKLSLSGRHVVLTMGDTRISVSAKITDPTMREHLAFVGNKFPSTISLSGTESIRVGYILRTESSQIDDSILMEEANGLFKRLEQILLRARYAKCGQLLYSKGSSVVKFILDCPQKQIQKILIEDRALYEQILQELEDTSPELAAITELYSDPSWSLAELYRVDSQLRRASSKQVYLDNGGYLFIEKTEALNVIDVNSGKEMARKNYASGLNRFQVKERAVTEFNKSCIKTIAQQIRLRNLSGIIVVDFINMNEKTNQQMIEEEMRRVLLQDPRKTRVYGFTRLQLLEITREKKGPALSDPIG